MEKYFKKIMDWRVIPAILSVILFFDKFIPLWQLSFYNHSNADDFWMSVSIHKVWQDTHSIFAAAGEAFYSAVLLWQDWDGCFLSMFLSGLSPVVFHESYYKYTFIILSIALIISVSVFMYALCVRLLKFRIMHYIILFPLILTILFNFSPSVKEGLYWWCGGINYTFFFSVLLMSQACLLEYMVSERWVFLGFGAVLGFCTGLGNLLTALVNPILLVLEFAVLLYWKKDKKREKWFFLIPVICGISGLLLNVMAPGNLVRGGSELFSSSPFGAVIDTIVTSTGFLHHFYRRPMIWFMLAIIFVILDAFRNSEIRFRFPCPLIVIVTAYLIYCAAFTPVVYAHNAYYGRCKDISFDVLVMISLCALIYTIGWLNNRFLQNKYLKIRHMAVYISLLAVLACSRIQGIYFDAEYARDALTTGTAQDFHDKVNGRFALYYNEEITQVEVQKIEWMPGLFYFDDDCLADIAYYFDKEYIKVAE